MPGVSLLHRVQANLFWSILQAFPIIFSPQIAHLDFVMHLIDTKAFNYDTLSCAFILHLMNNTVIKVLAKTKGRIIHEGNSGTEGDGESKLPKA